jgi:hypothetical protein
MASAHIVSDIHSNIYSAHYWAQLSLASAYALRHCYCLLTVMERHQWRICSYKCCRILLVFGWVKSAHQILGLISLEEFCQYTVNFTPIQSAAWATSEWTNSEELLYGRYVACHLHVVYVFSVVDTSCVCLEGKVLRSANSSTSLWACTVIVKLLGITGFLEFVHCPVF